MYLMPALLGTSICSVSDSGLGVAGAIANGGKTFFSVSSLLSHLMHMRKGSQCKAVMV